MPLPSGYATGPYSGLQTLSPQDVAAVAVLALQEARGMGYTGMAAVIDTLVNRAEVQGVPLSQVTVEHGQYPSMNPAATGAIGQNRANSLSIMQQGGPEWNTAVQAALDVISGAPQVRGITQGATHYYDADQMGVPDWAKGLPVATRIGSHAFYNAESLVDDNYAFATRPTYALPDFSAQLGELTGPISSLTGPPISAQYGADQALGLPQIRDDQTFSNAFTYTPNINPGAAAWGQPAATNFGGPVGPGDTEGPAAYAPGSPLAGQATLSSDFMHPSFDQASIAQPAYGAGSMPVDLASLPQAWTANSRFGIDATANAQPVSGLVVHTFGAEKPGQSVNFDKSVAALNTYDASRGGAFGYTFAIDTDGTIVQTAPLDVRTNQVKPADAAQRIGGVAPDVQNANTYGIAYFNQTPNAPPTQAQIDAIDRLTQTLVSTYGIDPKNVYGHGELQSDRDDTEGVSLAQQIRAGTLGVPSGVQTAGDLTPAAGADAFLGQQFDPYQSIQPAMQQPAFPHTPTPTPYGAPDEAARAAAFGALPQAPQTFAGGMGLDAYSGMPAGYGGLGAAPLAHPVTPTPDTGYAQQPAPYGGIDEAQRAAGFGSLALPQLTPAAGTPLGGYAPQAPAPAWNGISEEQRAAALGGPPRYAETPVSIPAGLPTVNPNFASAPSDVQQQVAPTPPTGAGPQWSGSDGTFDPTLSPGQMSYGQDAGGITEEQRATALGGPPRYAETQQAIPAGLPTTDPTGAYAPPGVAETVAPTPPTGPGPQWSGADGSFDETLSPSNMSYAPAPYGGPDEFTRGIGFGALPAPPSTFSGTESLDAFAGMPSGYGGLAPAPPAHPVTATPASGYPAGSQPAYQSRGTTGAFGFGADLGQSAIAAGQSIMGGMANAGAAALTAPAFGEAALGRTLNTPLDTRMTRGFSVTPADALMGTGWGAFAPQSTIDQATLDAARAAMPTPQGFQIAADRLGTKMDGAVFQAANASLAAMPSVAAVAQQAPSLMAGSIAPVQSGLGVAQTVTAPISQTPVVTQAAPEDMGAPAANTTYAETVAAAGAPAEPAAAPTSPFAGTPSPFGRDAYAGAPMGQSGYTTGGGMDDYSPDAPDGLTGVQNAAPQQIADPPTAGQQPDQTPGAIPTAAPAPSPSTAATPDASSFARMAGTVAAASPAAAPTGTQAPVSTPTRAATAVNPATAPAGATRGVSATTPAAAAPVMAPQTPTQTGGFGSIPNAMAAFPWATPTQQPSDPYSTASPFTPTGYGYAPEYAQIAATGGLWGGGSGLGIGSLFSGGGFGSLFGGYSDPTAGYGGGTGGYSIGGSTGANAGQGANYN